ncbi:STAS domain-containing protein [Streptomyces sp. NPDC046985]|uniref:STAS domain-containing protein n=1 Tax=Streptomyces sp. NPDC046985 TaxID=3155377 RepID=UPI0033E93A0C
MSGCDEQKTSEGHCAVDVTWVDDGRGLMIGLRGEFDVASELDVELVLELASRAESVDLDVSGVRFADSTLLNLMLRMADRLRVRLIGPLQPQLSELMRLTGVLARFEADAAGGEGRA